MDGFNFIDDDSDDFLDDDDFLADNDFLTDDDFLADDDFLEDDDFLDDDDFLEDDDFLADDDFFEVEGFSIKSGSSRTSVCGNLFEDSFTGTGVSVFDLEDNEDVPKSFGLLNSIDLFF
jgi:hypothetical protein